MEVLVRNNNKSEQKREDGEEAEKMIHHFLTRSMIYDLNSLFDHETDCASFKSGSSVTPSSLSPQSVVNEVRDRHLIRIRTVTT